MSDPLYQAALASALRLLARRDHAAAELRRHLQAHYDETTIAAVLTRCSQQGWLDEARMVESFIRGRAARGQGPLRIGFELRQRGIPSELIQAGLAGCDQDWFALARALAERRRGPDPLDRKASAKLLGFLVPAAARLLQRTGPLCAGKRRLTPPWRGQPTSKLAQLAGMVLL